MTATPPMLTDDRVESMRSTVMSAVDDDITRRGVRVRKAFGLAAVAVVVVGFGTVGIRAIDVSTGGSTSADSASSGAAADRAAAPEAAGDAGAAEKVAPEDLPTKRDVITTGTVNVTVKQPRAAAQRITSYVESIGGRVDGRTENGRGDDASAFLEIRVPSTKVSTTIERLGTYGTVEDVALQNDDVTSQTTDLDARIDALRISIKRLENILADSGTSAELIRAESALTNRQEQLESLVSQRALLSDQVALSTLSIDLTQEPRAESVSPGGFRGGLVKGWNALVATLNGVVEVAGVILPWAAGAVLVYGAYRLVSRRRRTG